MLTKALHVLTAICALSASFAMAQTNGPVALIYVSSNYSGDHNRVVGYAASADGKLTEIPGSPWADDVSYLATTGSYLFGTTNIRGEDFKNVFSYEVESNGALKYIGANNIQNPASENANNQAANLLLDHTGSYLYVFAHNISSDGPGVYESFAVNKITGLLKPEGTTDHLDTYAYPLTMLADNNWAFAVDGNESDGSNLICAYKKSANGALAFSDKDFASECSGAGSPGIANGPGQYFDVAADPTNHLAAAVVYAGVSDVEVKIATITIDPTTGAQSSSSNYNNMPVSDVQLILNQLSLDMAPSGKLLAVGGGNGIQIYNFNPGHQATPNTGLISRANVTGMYWDKNNHLYAISNADNTLHVFTVTATGAEEAPGSPYILPHPVAITGHSM